MHKKQTKDLITSLEWLRKTVEAGMEEQFKPVMKKRGMTMDEINYFLSPEATNKNNKNT